MKRSVQSGGFDVTSVDECIIALAGALAEGGVTELVLHRPGQAPRPLRARETDLPGTLRSEMSTGVLITAPRDTRLEITAGRVTWTTGDLLLAERLVLVESRVKG